MLVRSQTILKPCKKKAAENRAAGAAGASEEDLGLPPCLKKTGAQEGKS